MREIFYINLQISFGFQITDTSLGIQWDYRSHSEDQKHINVDKSVQQTWMIQIKEKFKTPLSETKDWISRHVISWLSIKEDILKNPH